MLLAKRKPVSAPVYQTLEYMEAILRGMSTSMMAVDTDLTIRYVNPSVLTFLRSVEADLKKELPAFSTDNLIGQNIDIFHKNPQRQRSMLASLNEAYRTTIRVGPHIFNLRAFPLFAPTRDRIGFAVEWLDSREMDNDAQLKALNRSQAVIEFNLDGTIIKANDNFLGALGYSLPEIAGKHHSIFVAPEERQTREYQDFWRKLASGEFQSAQYKRIHKTGRDVWIQASYNPVVDLHGKPFKVVKFASDITEMVNLQNQVIGNLRNIEDAVSQARMQASSAAAASTETSTNVQAVASGSEELDASVKEIASSMTKSKDAVQEMSKAFEVSEKATQSLLASAHEMSGILVMIQNIAGQINLLSLNATIEAARAGEAGKGFAVVASEVKTLANQAASATDKINTEISGIQTIAAQVSEAVASVNKVMISVMDYINTTSSAVEEQSVVTQDMSMNMQSAASAVSEISQSLNMIEVAISRADEMTKETQTIAEKISR